MIERRDDARRRVCLGGLIETAACMPEIPCTLRDVSLTGARIRVPDGAILPERVILRVPIRGESRLGRIVWRAGDMAGLQFVPDLTAEEGRELRERIRAGEAEVARLRAAMITGAGRTMH